MFTQRFWKQALERAAKTAAQFGLVALGSVVFTRVGEVVTAAQAVGLGALFGAAFSILTSLASSSIGEPGTPSAVREE